MLEARKAALEAQLQGEEGRLSQLSASEALLTELKEKAETADNITKRRLIETLVVHITVTVEEEGQIRLEPRYRFNAPKELDTSRQHQEPGGRNSGDLRGQR